MTNGDTHDRYVTLNGLQFHYRDWGAPDAPLLVILHGLNSHSWDWDFLAEPASQSYHVVALDMRGHGASDWSDDYGWPRYQEDLDALINALGAPTFTLLGYSVGGAIASTYAAAHPERLQSLIVVDNTPTRSGGGPKPEVMQAMREMMSQDSFTDAEELAAYWQRVDPQGSRDRILNTMRNNLKQRDDGRWVRRDDALNPYIRPDGAVTDDSSATPYIPPPEEHWSLLPSITCPTLVVHAQNSEIFNDAVMQQMAATIPDCRLVTLRDSGHRVQWDNPDGLLEIVLPFLRQ